VPGHHVHSGRSLRKPVFCLTLDCPWFYTANGKLPKNEGHIFKLKKREIGVSLNGGTPKSSILIILIGFSIINHPF